MIRKIIRGVITLLFGSIGVYINYAFEQVINENWLYQKTGLQINFLWTYLLGLIIFAVIGFFLAPICIRIAIGLFKWLESKLTKMPIPDLIGGAVGVIIGLIISSLLSSSISGIPYIGPILGVLISLFLGYIGLVIGMKRKEDLLNFFNFLPRIKGDKSERNEKGRQEKGNITHIPNKILDTSVIIDGRIADIVKTGFLDGVLLVPNFVLEELRHIADSPDILKRNRGRRGLDILNQISKEGFIKVNIYEGDFEEIAEVDSKLVKLANIIGAPILTNDYNLNKVAELQGIKVLNINELANAVKPVVLPGEEMYVQVMKEGKETGQGVAYLDDGTMVVIDGGRRYIGQHTSVLVTTVLQTAAGRMIFARPKGLLEKSAEEFSNEINLFG